jgi:hypothetical protein
MECSSEEIVMDIKIAIPDDVARRLGTSHDEVARKIFELAVAEGWRHELFFKQDLRILLGIDNSIDRGDFFEKYQIPIE